MQPIDHIGFDLLKLRVAEDGLCALTGFFGGLKEQHHLALVGTLLSEPLRQAAEDGGVTVVTAFVRNTLALRAVREVIRLGDMQSINVATDEDAFAGLCTFINSGQSESADFLYDLVGVGLFHPFVQNAVGQRFLAREFGMSVKDMAQFDEVLHGLKFATKLRKNALCFGFSLIFAPKFSESMQTVLYPLKFKPIFKDKIWGGRKIKEQLGMDYGPLPNCGEVWLLSGI